MEFKQNNIKFNFDSIMINYNEKDNEWLVFALEKETCEMRIVRRYDHRTNAVCFLDGVIACMKGKEDE